MLPSGRFPEERGFDSRWSPYCLQQQASIYACSPNPTLGAPFCLPCVALRLIRAGGVINIVLGNYTAPLTGLYVYIAYQTSRHLPIPHTPGIAGVTRQLRSKLWAREIPDRHAQGMRAFHSKPSCGEFLHTFPQDFFRATRFSYQIVVCREAFLAGLTELGLLMSEKSWRFIRLNQFSPIPFLLFLSVKRRKEERS